MSRYQARALAGMMLALMASIMPAFLTSALGVQLQADLGMDESLFGLVLASYFAAMGATSIAGGRLAERIGWRHAATATAVLGGLTMIGIVTLAQTWWSLLILLVLGGVSQGVGSPAANLTIAEEVPVSLRGITVAVKQSASPAAAVLAGLTVPLLAVTVGWRWAFVVALVLPMAALWTLAPRRLGRSGMAPVRATVSAAVAGRPLVMLAVAGALAATSVGALATFLVLSAVDAGLSPGGAGLLLTASSLGGVSVRLAGGRWADRVDTGGFRPAAGLLALGAIGTLLIATRSSSLVVPGSVLAFSAGWGWPGLFHYGVIRSHERRAAAATGITETGLALGTAIGPLVFGVLVSALDYAIAWTLCAAVFLLSGAMMWVTGGRLTRINETFPMDEMVDPVS